jgi:hypothetical protein
MNRLRPYLIAFVVLALLGPTATAQGLFPGLGDQRVGISSFTFLKIGVGARAIAMGEAFSATADDASALFWNPAAAVQLEGLQVMVSHTEWFAEVRHEFGAAVYHLTPEDAVGVSILALYTDDMPRTTTTMPGGTGEFFGYQDLALGVTYSRKMTTQFSFGITARYVREELAELSMQTLVFDLGAYYLTGFSTARFAIVVSSFGAAAKPSGSVDVTGVGTINEFEEFPPPTQFRLAFAMDPVLDETHRLTTTVQLNHPNDNAENIGLGLEYGWKEILFLRAGYRFNVAEQEWPSFGLGVKVPVEFSTIGFDYGAAHYGILGFAHRFSLGFEF